MIRNKNIRVAFYTLGCKLNQAETEFLSGQFNKAGYHLVSPDEIADIYIINTCTVTHIADRKSRHWLRLTRRKNPKSLIIATGCYAQRAPRELNQIADMVIDNKGKGHLLAIAKGLLPQYLPPVTTKKQNSECRKGEIKQSNTPYNTRVRSLIKIQNGCHSPCTYCIVPYVRTH